MKTRNLLSITLLTIFLTSCNGNVTSNGTKSSGSSFNGSSNGSSSLSTGYTIKWVNYDGTELEVDENVLEGTMPTYDGETPTKPSTDDYNYKFIGWSPEVVEVSKSTTYKAIYEEILKVMTFGMYPQTVVLDSDFSYELDVYAKTAQKEENGWIKYTDGSYYTSVVASPNFERYFEDGTKVVNKKSYWFKCEPIKWKVIKSDDSSLLLVSEKILDAHIFCDDNSSDYFLNNYKESSIRSWLNNEFYNTAFLDSKSRIKTTHIDNSPISTGNENNKYTCDDTDDKVFLLSRQDYQNDDYGFADESDGNYKNKANNKEKRKSKGTDYAIARGLNAWNTINSDSFGYGSYWTRSPMNEPGGEQAWTIDYSGAFDTISGSVRQGQYGVVPAITINKAMA